MRVPLIGSSSSPLCSNQDSARVFNMFADLAESSEAKVPAVLVGTPGLGPIADSLGDPVRFATYPVRGLLALTPLEQSAHRCIVVSGNTVYRLDPEFDQEIEGTIANDGYLVSMAQSPNQILIASNAGSGYVYDILTRSISGPVLFDADPTTPVGLYCVVNIAQYFVGLIRSGLSNSERKIVYSTINDATTWSSLDYFEPESNPDSAIGLLTIRDELWCYGESSIDIFKASGDPNNPFSPIVAIQIGSVAARSVQIIGESPIWIGSEQDRGGFGVYMAVGYRAVKVSNAYIDKRLMEINRDYGFGAIREAIGISRSDYGHQLYKLTLISGKASFLYDATTKKWFDSGYWNATTGLWEADLEWNHAFFRGIHIVGDRRDGLPYGGLYEQSLALFDNDVLDQTGITATTAAIRRVVRGHHIASPNKKRLEFSDLELEFERGQGLITGQGSDPECQLRWSDDGGKTFPYSISLKVGAQGDYKKRVRLARWGSAYDRVPEIVMTDPVAWRLVGASCDVKELAS